MILIFAGLGFKITAVPFHFYAPDVYQGTTNANAALLAVVPKIAGVVGLVRLTLIALPLASDTAWQIAIVLSILTMTLGNICALWQSNLRRLLAYSSIAHGGYLLIGLAVALTSQVSGGVAAMLFYLIVYSFGSLGAFATLAMLSSEERPLDRIEQLHGLGRRHPLAAAAMSVFMFSLAGLPPLAGFWGKLSLFTSAISLSLQSEKSGLSFWFLVLAIVGALNAAVAAAYYLRIVSVMYFRESDQRESAPLAWSSSASVALCAAAILAIGVVPGLVMTPAQSSDIMLQTSPPESEVTAPAHAVPTQIAGSMD